MDTDDRYSLEKFELYIRARGFRKKVYLLVRQLPVDEKSCLDPQMRRAAVSVTNNIAEGHARWYYQDNMRFLRISRGSIGELIDDFQICIDERYGNQQLAHDLISEAHELMRRVNGYIRYLQRCKQGGEVEKRNATKPPITSNQ